MKLGITAKLFLALLATSVIVALAVNAGTRLSFNRGFVGYLNEQGQARGELLVPAITAAYREHGGWDFLRENPREWFNITRPARRTELQGQTQPDLTGTNMRMLLVDERGALLIGPPNVHPKAGTPSLPIVVNDAVVGRLYVLPFQQVTAGADVRFQQSQFRTGWVIVALVVLLAALVAMGLARFLLAPIRRIAQGTHRLAAGDYSSRIATTSNDEIGGLAEDFNRMASALERNEQTRRAFIADISHELRTPLAVLRGEVEAMQDGVRPLTAEALQSLHGEIRTLTQLVNDLYDLSLSDVGALTYRKSSIDVIAVLRTTLSGLHDRLGQRQLRLDVALPEMPVTVYADENRLQQLFTNIIENSARYTDEGGVLQLRCALSPGWVELSFADSPPGVDAEALPRLFDRFYRVEASRNRETGGAGLGLAICKGIVDAHNGVIAAKPSPLGGVMITVALSLPA